MLYTLEQRIHTLAQNVIDTTAVGVTGFPADDVVFSPWQVDQHDDWWTNQYWLATTEIEASNYREAWNIFWNRLARLVPRMTLVSQCYTDYLSQPLLIRRTAPDVAFIRWTKERGAIGLMFMDDELKALNSLLKNSQIPNEFFWYWNDATNSTGYASKLLLMLSAVETLVTTRSNGRKPQKDYAKLELILGSALKKDLWGTQADHLNALRHRLIHGEYFELKDGKQDYLLLLHRKIITYFNDVIFQQKLLHENIVNPQRHPTDYKDQADLFLQARGTAKLRLIDVFADLVNNGIDNLEHYEHVRDFEIRKNC